MGATHEQVNLMLHLYELRREAKLREATRLDVREFSSKIRGRSHEARAAGDQGKYVYADGARLLGDGGQHCQPRTRRRRTVF